MNWNFFRNKFELRKMEKTVLRNKPTFRSYPLVKSFPSLLPETDAKPKIHKFISLNFLPVGDDFEFEQNEDEFVDMGKGPAEILDYLFIGSEEHASNLSQLKEHNISSVLNVAKGCRNYFEDDLEYFNLPVLDICEEDISTIFQKSYDFIEQVHLSGGKVLVHCNAGISRSATICAAYLMKRQGLTMDEALKTIKEKRNCISPNFGFLLKLMKLQDTLQTQA